MRGTGRPATFSSGRLKGTPVAKVELVPMSDGEFAPYLETLIPEYAADHVRNGRWTKEESLGEARREVMGLLSKGVATRGHHIYSIRAVPGGTRVGILWVYVRGPRAFIYDLNVDAAHRRKGYGRAAMQAAEPAAREFGASTIALHVFGDNTGARALYRELGYRETNVQMAKDLG